jgi:hypothetical protein
MCPADREPPRVIDARHLALTKAAASFQAARSIGQYTRKFSCCGFITGSLATRQSRGVSGFCESIAAMKDEGCFTFV